VAAVAPSVNSSSAHPGPGSDQEQEAEQGMNRAWTGLPATEPLSTSKPVADAPTPVSLTLLSFAAPPPDIPTRLPVTSPAHDTHVPGSPDLRHLHLQRPAAFLPPPSGRRIPPLARPLRPPSSHHPRAHPGDRRPHGHRRFG